jgi:hypothetical protein
MSVNPSPETTGSNELFVCGYPKTGRTWLRYMLANTLVEHFDLGVEVDLNNVYSIIPNDEVAQIDGQPDFAFEGVLPRIQMSHKPYDPQLHEDARLAFLTRDPRDIMVSHWLHDRNQVHLFNGDLPEYVKDPNRGIAAFILHIESWAPHLSKDQIKTYESMRAEPARALGDILSVLGVHVSEVAIQKAVELGEINKMRKVEASKGIAGQSYDKSNPEARRVRRGKVGGFSDYLSPEDLSYIDASLGQISDEAKKIIAMTPYAQRLV